MYDINQYYGESYYGKRMAFKETVYPLLSKAIEEVMQPTDIVDVGCGNGVLMEGFSVSCVGIEASDEGVKHTANRGYTVTKHDLRNKLNIERFNLAVSVEVAEHLEEEFADMFVDNLVSLSDNVVVTASNVRGYSHFNPQPKSYWIDKFKLRGYELSNKTEEIVNIAKLKIKSPYDYLYNNLMVFIKV